MIVDDIVEIILLYVVRFEFIVTGLIICISISQHLIKCPLKAEKLKCSMIVDALN